METILGDIGPAFLQIEMDAIRVTIGAHIQLVNASPIVEILLKDGT